MTLNKLPARLYAMGNRVSPMPRNEAVQAKPTMAGSMPSATISKYSLA